MSIMKKYIVKGAILLSAIAGLAACNSKDDDSTVWDRYADWREANQTWFAEQEMLTNPDGTPFYTRVSPPWNPGAVVLMHWYNDRSETEGNLSPMITSTVSTRYIGHLYNDEPFDSSLNASESGIFTTRLGAVVEGWQIALINMRVGDTCQVVFPYQQGYGAYSQGSILPYSALRFNMRLTDIPAYEIR